MRYCLNGIRQISLLPVIVLSDIPEQDVNSVVQLGADMCVSGKHLFSMVVDHAFAQLRRYTQYNPANLATNMGDASLQIGDIFIDPLRRIVKVRDQPVNLRPREFSLLLYFVRSRARGSSQRFPAPGASGGVCAVPRSAAKTVPPLSRSFSLS